MSTKELPALPDFRPRFRSGTLEYPVHHMRGGTSTGLVLWEGFAPDALSLREELLRHLMGVPLTGRVAANRQITGLGRGPATSLREHVCGLATLGAGHGDLGGDALPTSEIEIRNTNTGSSQRHA